MTPRRRAALERSLAAAMARTWERAHAAADRKFGRPLSPNEMVALLRQPPPAWTGTMTCVSADDFAAIGRRGPDDV